MSIQYTAPGFEPVTSQSLDQGSPLPDIHFVHSFHCIVIVHAIAVLYQITLSVEPNVTQSFQINLITR